MEGGGGSGVDWSRLVGIRRGNEEGIKEEGGGRLKYYLGKKT